MTPHHVFSFARIVGHSAWWVFMVVTLFAGGVTWTGASRYLGATSTGWSGNSVAYRPIQSPVAIANFTGTSSFYDDPWTELEILSVIAISVVLIAAVIEAVSARQLLRGAGTIAAPCVAFALLLLATPGVLDNLHLGTTQTLALVLAAVAVREVWARGFAPLPPFGARGNRTLPEPIVD